MKLRFSVGEKQHLLATADTGLALRKKRPLSGLLGEKGAFAYGCSCPSRRYGKIPCPNQTALGTEHFRHLTEHSLTADPSHPSHAKAATLR
jgi:hypothetical protein